VLIKSSCLWRLPFLLSLHGKDWWICVRCFDEFFCMAATLDGKGGSVWRLWIMTWIGTAIKEEGRFWSVKKKAEGERKRKVFLLDNWSIFRCVEASQQSGGEGLGTEGCVVKGREVSQAGGLREKGGQSDVPKVNLRRLEVGRTEQMLLLIHWSQSEISCTFVWNKPWVLQAENELCFEGLMHRLSLVHGSELCKAFEVSNPVRVCVKHLKWVHPENGRGRNSVFWLVEAYVSVDLGCLSSDDALSFWLHECFEHAKIFVISIKFWAWKLCN